MEKKNNFEIIKIIILSKNRTPIWGFDFLCIVENNKKNVIITI